MKRFKTLFIIVNIMISSRDFKYNKQVDNKNITINFDAYSFSDNKICFVIFRKMLNTKINININKLFGCYSKMLENVNKNKKVNPIQISNDLEDLFINFNNLCTEKQINKLTELLDYILIYKSYFIESKFLMNALKKKIIKIFYCNKAFKILKYYYFIIFKVNSIKIDIIKNKLNYYDENHYDNYTNKDTYIDFNLDNPDTNILWCDIINDLNFY